MLHGAVMTATGIRITYPMGDLTLQMNLGPVGPDIGTHHHQPSRQVMNLVGAIRIVQSKVEMGQ